MPQQVNMRATYMASARRSFPAPRLCFISFSTKNSHTRELQVVATYKYGGVNVSLSILSA